MDAYFQELQELDEGSAGTGHVAEVLNIFLNDGDRILRDIDSLLSVPCPLHLAALLSLLVSVTDSLGLLCLICDSQEQAPARGELLQGGRPGAAAQGEQLYV